jgi:hypothetical protein
MPSGAMTIAMIGALIALTSAGSAGSAHGLELTRADTEPPATDNAAGTTTESAAPARTGWRVVSSVQAVRAVYASGHGAQGRLVTDTTRSGELRSFELLNVHGRLYVTDRLTGRTTMADDFGTFPGWNDISYSQVNFRFTVQVP